MKRTLFQIFIKFCKEQLQLVDKNSEMSLPKLTNLPLNVI